MRLIIAILFFLTSAVATSHAQEVGLGFNAIAPTGQALRFIVTKTSPRTVAVRNKIDTISGRLIIMSGRKILD